MGCQKSPDEPASRTGANDLGAQSIATTNKRADAGRCVKRLSEVPPLAPKNSPASNCPKDPDGNMMLRVAKVTFPEAKADSKREAGVLSVNVELAETEKASERGLMYRTQMPEESGMLFRLSTHSDHTFWMKNTCLSLDMMFIDDDGFIVGIVENAPTLSEEIQSVGCASRYVLEVNAGWSRRHGVFPGQSVVLPPH